MFGEKHEKRSQTQKDIERLTAEMHLLQKPETVDGFEYFDPDKLAKARKIQSQIVGLQLKHGGSCEGKNNEEDRQFIRKARHEAKKYMIEMGRVLDKALMCQKQGKKSEYAQLMKKVIEMYDKKPDASEQILKKLNMSENTQERLDLTGQDQVEAEICIQEYLS